MPDKGETVDYRKNTEEEMILEFLSLIKNGFFVEVGANDPTNISTTYPLEQQGWRGILVEPLPNWCKLIREVRTAPVFECACGAPDDPREMVLSVEDTFSALKGRSIHSSRPATEITVRVRTLNSILEEVDCAKIDFLSIDVEGGEFHVLQGFNIAKYRPKLVFIEDHVHSLKVHRYFLRNGYKIIRRTGVNNWYVPADCIVAVPLGERLRLFRKLYIGTPWRAFRIKFLRR
jgi:FkbM family methyltransferase